MKNFNPIFFILVFGSWFSIDSARASQWVEFHSTGPAVPCLGLDGVPFSSSTQGAALVAKCCTTTNGVSTLTSSDASCVGSGLADNGEGNAASTFSYAAIATNTLHNAQGLGTVATTVGTTPTPSSGADQSAETLGNGAGSSGSGSAAVGTNPTLASTDPGTAGSGAGSGSGATGDLGGMSGSGTGNSKSSASGNADGTGNVNGGKDLRMAYVHGAGAGENGSKESSGKVGTDVGDEVKFGNAGLSGKDGNTSAQDGLVDDDGVRGVTEDSADYLKRIDKSASIFKVVTTAYMRKKSLWRVKEDELKLKKQ